MSRGVVESPRGVAARKEGPGARSSCLSCFTLKGRYAAGKASVPCNYAYDEDDGYSGLLLYELSPPLAEALYPILATPATEAVMTTILVLGIAISMPPQIHPGFSADLAYASFLLYIPALHRLSLLDVPRLLLLIRQFETWWV